MGPYGSLAEPYQNKERVRSIPHSKCFTFVLTSYLKRKEEKDCLVNNLKVVISLIRMKFSFKEENLVMHNFLQFRLQTWANDGIIELNSENSLSPILRQAKPVTSCMEPFGMYGT